MTEKSDRQSTLCYIVQLAGDMTELAEHELLQLLETKQRLSYLIKRLSPNFLLLTLSCSGNEGREYIQQRIREVLSRSSLCKLAFILLDGHFISKNIESTCINEYYTGTKFEMMEKSELLKLIGEKVEDCNLSALENSSFVVRTILSASRVKSISSAELERYVGKEIFERVENVKVNFKNPDYVVRAVLLPTGVYIGIQIFERRRSFFDKRAPHHRPYYRAGAMRPEIARMMVNLSGAQPGDIFLDPFAGTGTLALEAASMGINAIAAELHPRICKGISENYNQFKITHFTGGEMPFTDDDNDSSKHFVEKYGKMFTYSGSALKIPLKKVDAIATDPPYQITSSTRGYSLDLMLNLFFQNVKKVLKTDGFFCIALPKQHNISEKVLTSGLAVVSRKYQRVHKSLIREFVIGSLNS